MSFDTFPPWGSRTQESAQSTLEDEIGKLVEPPKGRLKSAKVQDRIDTEASSFPEVAQYAEQLTGYWNASEVSNDDLAGVRTRLVGDAVKLNAMVHDQIEIAHQANTLYTELDRAWEAAAINAQIARTMYSKVLPDQSEELLALRAKVAALEKEQSVKELLAAQHKELTEKFGLAADDRKELERLRANANTRPLTPILGQVAAAQAAAAQAAPDQLQEAIKNLTAEVKGIKSTTDQIAQAMNQVANEDQAANDPKRRSQSDLRIRSESGDREPAFSPTGPSGPRRASVQIDAARGGRSMQRRSSMRVSRRPGSQPASQPSPTSSGVTQTTTGGEEADEDASAPEAATPTPPPSSSQPQNNILDHTDAQDVLSNILAWDGDEFFPTTEVPNSVVDDLKASITEKLVDLDKNKFHTAFTASVNRPGMACVWQRSLHSGKTQPNGYHACKDCVSLRRPCVIRAKNQAPGRNDRPHLAPLPDDLRPADATRADAEYWVLSDPQDVAEDTPAES
ncbi:hypothetical protein KCU77_g901, partial [Aureobasidium melanogenum]